MNVLKEKYHDNTGRLPSPVQGFFILCSGADKGALYQCPSEWNKFAGIGATIFLTACLAALSGGYAIHFAFDNLPISILFAIFWAVVIFNLDRYIVLSLRKERIPTLADIHRETDGHKQQELKIERRRLLWHQALMASPRFIIAVIIALTVSKPLELRLFNSSIEKELASTAYGAEARFDAEEMHRIDSLNARITGIDSGIAARQREIYSGNFIFHNAVQNIPKDDSALQEKSQKMQRNDSIIARNKPLVLKTKTISKQGGDGDSIVRYFERVPNDIARQKMAENRRLGTDTASLTRDLVKMKSDQTDVSGALQASADDVEANRSPAKKAIALQIENLKQTYTQRKQDYISSIQKNTDLPARLEALGHISKWFNPIWWAGTVITLLFIVLETAPVVVKLLSRRGPYDEIIDGIEYSVYLEESRKIDELNRTVSQLIQKANDAAVLAGDNFLTLRKDELEKQLLQNQEVLQKVADRQKELAEIYIETWFKEEKQKAQQNAGNNHRPPVSDTPST
jgi:hypothetical protein